MSLSPWLLLRPAPCPIHHPTPKKSAGTTESKGTCYLFLTPLCLDFWFLHLSGSSHPTPSWVTSPTSSTSLPPLGIDFQIPIAVPDSEFALGGSGGHLCGTMTNTDLHLESVFLLEFPSRLLKPEAESRSPLLLPRCPPLISQEVPSILQNMFAPHPRRPLLLRAGPLC